MFLLSGYISNKAKVGNFNETVTVKDLNPHWQHKKIDIHGNVWACSEIDVPNPLKGHFSDQVEIDLSSV